jgi:hypothetical protein
LFLSDLFLYFPSFFSTTGKEVEEWWDIMREEVGCAGATTPAL